MKDSNFSKIEQHKYLLYTLMKQNDCAIDMSLDCTYIYIISYEFIKKEKSAIVLKLEIVKDTYSNVFTEA